MSKPRLGITTKLFLWGMLALLLAIPITAALTWLLATEHAQAEVQNQIDEGLQGFESEWKREDQDLVILGRWLVKQENFILLARSGDGPGLTKLLEPLTKASVVDMIEVVDSKGIVLSRVREGETATQGDNILTQPGFAEALLGHESYLLDEDKSKTLQGHSILPVYDGEKTSPIGVLILSFYLNDTFLRNSLMGTTRDIAIANKDRIAVTTLTERGDKALVGQLTPSAVIKAEREGTPSRIVTMETSEGEYLFKFRPLQSSDHSTLGMFGVGISSATLDYERASLFKTFGVGLFAGVVILFLVGLLSARALTAPIRKLAAEAQTMAGGDLSTSIELKRNDELGELARQMDLMRRKLSQALQSSSLERKRYEAVIQSMAVPVVMTDEDFRIRILNRAAETLLRQSQSSLIGQAWHNLFVLNEKDDGAGAPFWRTGMAGTSGEPNLIVGGRFPLRVQPDVVLDVISAEVKVEGKPYGYVHSLQDSSKLEEFTRIKDEFLLNIAHELQGPLSSWRASLDIMIEGYAALNARDLSVMLRTLQKVAVKFQDLIENLIDIGKVQAGRFSVRPMSVLLQQLIQDAASQIEPLLQSKGQSLEVKTNSPPACMVLADRPRIIQVVINLLKNASKYGPEDQPIALSTYCEGEFVYVEVTDLGPGIPPEEQTHLFQRFYRGKRAEVEGSGIGLGLALAKGIVEAHSGQIGVRSQVGEGATFWFRLPVGHRM